MFESAACRKYESSMFFPESPGTDGYSAKKVCADCLHIKECRVAGMMEEYGIWGGLSQRGRVKHRAIARRILGVTRSNANIGALFHSTQKAILEDVDRGIPIEEAMYKRGFTPEDVEIFFENC